MRRMRTPAAPGCLAAWLGLWFGLGLGASPADVAARPRPRPPAPPPLSPSAERATQLTERAYELQRQGRLNDAIRAYEEALAADPLPKRHRNLGIPLEQAGRLVEALRQYWLFQRDERGEPPENRQDVAERVARLLPRLARLQAPPPSPSELGEDVTPAVRVPTALSERPRCLAASEQPPEAGAAGPAAEPVAPAAPPRLAPAAVPGVYLCEPGPVEVELLLRGAVVASRRVTVAAGRPAEVRFAPRAPLRLRGNRERPSLAVDGAPLPLPPSVRLPVDVPLLLGAHELVARDGREVLRRAFTVREGQGAEVELRFSPRRTWLWFVIGGAALAAAGVAAGVGAYAATRPAPPGGADITLPPPM